MPLEGGLVAHLSHQNGWWRDTAQRLLVERGDTSAVPQLKRLAAQSPDWRTRLHALWTLDGLDAIERQFILWFDRGHVVRVLFQDNRVVTPDILQSG